MKYVLPILLVLGAGFIALGVFLGRDATPKPPNVVLIVMDTLRADRVEAQRNGEPVMPFLSSFAKQGTNFANAMSPCSWTKPTMASVFTGVSPQAHGVIFTRRIDGAGNETSDVLSKDWITLASWLKFRGYDRWAYQTNANLKSEFGFDFGYDKGQYHFQDGAPATAVTDAAVGALGGLEPPFLLYAHYMDAHAPYTPPEFHRDLFGPLPERTAYDRSVLNDPPGKFMKYYLDRAFSSIGLKEAPEMQDLSHGGKQAVEHLYDALARYMDGEIERLVTTIRKEDPNTVFVFLSDHGEEFWERGGMGHGTTLHQEQERVPFIIVGPDIPAQQIESNVSTVDLLPTLAAYLKNYLKITPSARWEGRDVLGNLDPDAPVFAFTKGDSTNLNVHVEACFQGGYSYMEDLSHGWKALYNHEDDPLELDDLSKTDPARVEAMATLLQAHRKSANAAHNSITQESVEVDAETKEKLRRLGYGEETAEEAGEGGGEQEINET